MKLHNHGCHNSSRLTIKIGVVSQFLEISTPSSKRVGIILPFISLWNLFLFHYLVISDSLQAHGLQHTRPPCPSLPLRVCPVHVIWVRDAIQPSHPLSSPSPPAFNLSQHQGLFQWVSCLHQVAKVLELQPQHQSFQWIFRIEFLQDLTSLLETVCIVTDWEPGIKIEDVFVW